MVVTYVSFYHLLLNWAGDLKLYRLASYYPCQKDIVLLIVLLHVKTCDKNDLQRNLASHRIAGKSRITMNHYHIFFFFGGGGEGLRPVKIISLILSLVNC